MKRIVLTVLACMCFVAVLAVSAFAAPVAADVSDSPYQAVSSVEAVLNAECGENLTWTLNEGTLTISGTGEMTSWDSVEETPWYAAMASIRRIVVKEGVTSIGSNAFYAEGQTEIEVEDKDLFFAAVDSGKVGEITWEIGDNGCLYLSGEGALSDFASADAVAWKAHIATVTAVSIGNGITAIGDYAFYGFTKLESVLVPESVTEIGDYAFANCSLLGMIVFEGEATVPSTAFSGCSALTSVGFGSYDCYKAMTETLGGDYDYYIGYKKVVEVSLPDSVEAIGEGAFDAFYPVISGVTSSYAKTYADEKGYKFVSAEVVINIGARASATNVRYIEIDGNQKKITENANNTVAVPAEKNILVEITEKTSEDSVFTVSTKYYYVDIETLTYSEISSLGAYMKNEDDVSIRTKDPVSMRFKAGIASEAKFEEEDFVIEEYGFIVGRKSLLDEKGKQLNFDFDYYVSGAAYNKELDIDIVYDGRDDENIIFTGILVNVPRAHYKTEVVTKTYTKVKVNGEEFVVYGEPVCSSMYDTAKSILASDTVLDETEIAVLEGIVNAVDGKNESDISSEGLFG